jgi:hypothetical protein
MISLRFHNFRNFRNEFTEEERKELMDEFAALLAWKEDEGPSYIFTDHSAVFYDRGRVVFMGMPGDLGALKEESEADFRLVDRRIRRSDPTQGPLFH